MPGYHIAPQVSLSLKNIVQSHDSGFQPNFIQIDTPIVWHNTSRLSEEKFPPVENRHP